jgi:hypothetical protein
MKKDGSDAANAPEVLLSGRFLFLRGSRRSHYCPPFQQALPRNF